MPTVKRIPVTNSAFAMPRLTFTAMDCSNCGTIFCVTDEFNAQREWDGNAFCCPNGHCLSYTSERKKLEAQVDKLEQRNKSLSSEVDWERTRAATAERSRAATQGQLTRLKRRVTNGVCAFCHRHFVNVERHVQSKHPDEKGAS